MVPEITIFEYSGRFIKIKIILLLLSRNSIGWIEVVKKEAKGLDDADLREVHEV
ncbi:MAG TPA: hypothetical protein VJR94_00235 [Candidatus Nitrosocosmicus sp.]|nr:hypothetical protein [Candidatus Nitrosocosmicus sp.]